MHICYHSCRIRRDIKIFDGKVRIKCSQKFYDAILNIGIPKTGVELAHAIYTSNWLSTTIPGLAKLIDPLRQVLKSIHKAKDSNRKKKAMVGVDLKDYGWGDEQTAAWEDFVEAVRGAAENAVYESSKELCLWRDASDHFFSVVVTQCESAELEKPYDKQHHEPLYFLSGKFKGAQENWHISSKECWPILSAMKRFDWLFHGHPRELRIFCDHNNLVTILNPNGKQTENKATLTRLYIYMYIYISIYYIYIYMCTGIYIYIYVYIYISMGCVLMSEFSYTIQHVPGQYNVLLSRGWFSRLKEIRKAFSVTELGHLRDQTSPTRLRSRL